MKNGKNKIIVTLCAMTVTAGLLAGCATGAATQDAAVAEDTSGTVSTAGEEKIAAEESSGEAADDALMVQVQSVDGTTVTAAIGEMGGRGGMPEDGEMPDLSEADGERPEMPEGEAPEQGERPEGMEPPENGEIPEQGEWPEDGEMPAGGGQFVAGEETLTFELTDATAITVQSTEGSADGGAEDIAEGTLLMLVLDEEGNAVEITIMNMGSPAPENADAQAAQSE